jgi:hypothetical protein
MLMADTDMPSKLHPLQDTHPYLALDVISASNLVLTEKYPTVTRPRKSDVYEMSSRRPNRTLNSSLAR